MVEVEGPMWIIPIANTLPTGAHSPTTNTGGSRYNFDIRTTNMSLVLRLFIGSAYKFTHLKEFCVYSAVI